MKSTSHSWPSALCVFEPHVAFKSEPCSFLQHLRSCVDRISLPLSSSSSSGLFNAAPPLAPAARSLRATRPCCAASSGYGRRCRWRGPSCDQCRLVPSAVLCLAGSHVVWWAGPPAGSHSAAVRGTLRDNGRRLVCTHGQMAGWGVARIRPGLGLWPPRMPKDFP